MICAQVDTCQKVQSLCQKCREPPPDWHKGKLCIADIEGIFKADDWRKIKLDIN